VINQIYPVVDEISEENRIYQHKHRNISRVQRYISVKPNISVVDEISAENSNISAQTQKYQ
jgi:hypothetical protein